MHIRLILLLALSLACASSSEASRDALPEAPPHASIDPAMASVEGTVRGAGGEPVTGAVVALVPADPNWDPTSAPPAGRVRSDAQGRFRFEGIAPGNYSLTATALSHAAGYKPGLKLVASGAARDTVLSLGQASHILRGQMTTEEGQPLAQTWLSFGRIGSDTSDDMLYVQTDERGAYQVALGPGEFGIIASPDGFLPAMSAVTVKAEELSKVVDLTLKRRPETAPPTPEVVSWLKQASAPLTSVEAGHGFADLQPLKPWLEGARIVALGEATHGSREFFQLKHRMLEFLATELGFTVFAIEANFGEALAINDYVLTGKGDPGRLLAGLYLWAWDTEELLTLIRWMRAYNADPKHEKKLKFYGVDMQFTAASAQALLDYFGQVDPSFRKRVAAALMPFADPKQGPELRTPEAVKTLSGLVANLEARLQSEHAGYARKTSEKAWALAARHARVLGQYAERVGSQETTLGSRDRAMAENTRWILEHEGAGTKMVLWAHNAHVSTFGKGESTPLGKHLRDVLGRELYVFGFAFNQGSFQAVHSPARPDEAPRGLSVHTVPPADGGSLDGTLARTGWPVLALDLRSLPREGAVADYFARPRFTRNYGAIYSTAIRPRATRVTTEYDGLLFVEKTQTAVATPTGRRPPPQQQTKDAP